MNENLRQAKEVKNDEFYTQLSDIQAELINYTDKFQGKVVFCNCDDPFESNFVKYFLMNFNRLGIKELIASGYKLNLVGDSEIVEPLITYALRVKDTKKYLVGTQKDLDIRGAKCFLEAEKENIMIPLIGNSALDESGQQIQISVKEEVIDKNGNPVLDKKGKVKTKTVKKDLYYESGDFRSDMCISLLKEADICVTNPPFSLFREYVNLLMKHNKQFLIIGNLNAITYKEIFPLFMTNKIWLGYGFQAGNAYFSIPDDCISKYDEKVYNAKTKLVKFRNCNWFTNIDHPKRHQMLPLDLGFVYNGHEDMYPKYDNYNAINVDKVSEIPCDYEPCWYKCPHATNCQYALTKGEDENNALCEMMQPCEEADRQTDRQTDEWRRKCNGIIGVPISFLDKYCPEQFRIKGIDRYVEDNPNFGHRFKIKEKEIYARILIQKCNGVMGVPISFLDKYCPEQFEILGYTSGRNEFDKLSYPTKRYINAIQHNTNGTTANGSKANTRATIIANTPKGVYYTADNCNYKLEIMYARILILKKDGNK